jgi:hypothetical protein
MAINPIQTLEDLEDHLWAAAAVEFSTIPLYLYAMYSLKVAGDYSRQDVMTPLSTFRGIVIEEMLHLCLVRNIYIAIGNGVASNRPLNFYDPALIPTYPKAMRLREPALMFNLAPYSADQLKTFLELELPANLVTENTYTLVKPDPKTRPYENLRSFYSALLDRSGALSADAANDPVRAFHLQQHESAPARRKGEAAPLMLDTAGGPPAPYHSLGQFYDRIMDGLQFLSAADPLLFTRNNNLNFQMPGMIYYSDPDGGGDVIRVVDLNTALACCTQIKDQGEGTGLQCVEGKIQNVPWVAMDYSPKPPYRVDPSGFGTSEPSHYYRFKQMGDGIYVIRDADVWPAMTNPTASAFGPGPLEGLAIFFNAAYCYLLAALDDVFNTDTVDPNIRPQPVYDPKTGKQKIDPVTGKPVFARPYTKEKFALIQSILAQMSGLLYNLSDILMQQELPSGCNAGPTFEYYAFDRKTSPKQQMQKLYDDLTGDFPQLEERGVRKMIGLLYDIALRPEHRPVHA